MKKKYIFISFLIIALAIFYGFKNQESDYSSLYLSRLSTFELSYNKLIEILENQSGPITDSNKIREIKAGLTACREHMKRFDFWGRYIDPLAYKSINAPLEVEWETEVFEKFETPYRRTGAGLTLAEQALDEDEPLYEHVLSFLKPMAMSIKAYQADSNLNKIQTPDHFYFCNRLYLLNLASIYTNGFECPDTSHILTELLKMTTAQMEVYLTYNKSFDNTHIPETYIQKYSETIEFIKQSPKNFTNFNHFEFISKYIQPLYAQNTDLIKQYKLHSRSLLDYSINKNCRQIFSKSLYTAQNPKGIFSRIEDSLIITEIEELGKLLFYDPILSGNNQRSCASCHQAQMFFTDTTAATSFQFNSAFRLERNSPSLINAEFNHLLMTDGKHLTLQDQVKAVLLDPKEMGSREKELIKKINSCKIYRNKFEKLLFYTPQAPKLEIAHIASAITMYYSKFSRYSSAFDRAMNQEEVLSQAAIIGFNLFMGKANCGTCHFVPLFNGVKPPYIGSEFEVLGVPEDSLYKQLSKDSGRFQVHAVDEMLFAFRTGTIRNAFFTAPYMHNGVFKNLHQVMNFYNEGGGHGKNLKVKNQTLSSDKLNLSQEEINYLLAFIRSLTENIPFELLPNSLPVSKNKKINNRKIGGTY